MRIKHVMTSHAYACSPDQSLNDVARIMWEHDLGCVPIVDSARKILGIVTDRDIAMAAYTQGRSLANIPARDVMSRHVYVCGPDEDIEYALERMSVHQLRRLPVTDATGAVLGMVSLNDLALLAAQDRGGRAAALQKGVALTLAKICEHRGASATIAPHAEAPTSFAGLPTSDDRVRGHDQAGNAMHARGAPRRA